MTPTATHDTSPSTSSATPTSDLKVRGSEKHGSGTTLRVIKRSGVVAEWDADKISAAIAKAFLAVEGASAAGSPRIHDIVRDLTQAVSDALTRRADATRADDAHPQGGVGHGVNLPFQSLRPPGKPGRCGYRTSSP